MLLPICDPISLPPSSLRVLSFLFLSISPLCPSAAAEPPGIAPSMPSGNTNLLTCSCSRSQHACRNFVTGHTRVGDGLRVGGEEVGLYFPRQVLIPGRVLAAVTDSLVAYRVQLMTVLVERSLRACCRNKSLDSEFCRISWGNGFRRGDTVLYVLKCCCLGQLPLYSRFTAQPLPPPHSPVLPASGGGVYKGGVKQLPAAGPSLITPSFYTTCIPVGGSVRCTGSITVGA